MEDYSELVSAVLRGRLNCLAVKGAGDATRSSRPEFCNFGRVKTRGSKCSLCYSHPLTHFCSCAFVDVYTYIFECVYLLLTALTLRSYIMIYIYFLFLFFCLVLFPFSFLLVLFVLLVLDATVCLFVLLVQIVLYCFFQFPMHNTVYTHTPYSFILVSFLS